MLRNRPTAADIKAYRDEHECGLYEAVAAVSKQWRLDCVADIRMNASELHTVEQCRDVIVDMLALMKVLVERGQ